MVCMLFAYIFYSEVVDDECEADRSCVVFPKAWGFVTLSVACESQSLLEELLCDDAGVW